MNYSFIRSASRWLAILWTLVMLIGCLTPQDQLFIGQTWNDKVLHILIFMPFAGLWILAGFRPNSIVLISFAFGVFIELLQYLLPINRTADWKDVVADCIGTILGALLAWRVQRFVNR
ncbi:VanZ family protein [Spirosoma areae]